jgi:hypothetical protein
MAKVPKGTKNAGCFAKLPVSMMDEALAEVGNQPRGSSYGLQWAEAQIHDIEYYMMKLDLHKLANARMTTAVRGHKLDSYRGAQGILRPDPYLSSGTLSVEARGKAIRGKMSTILAGALDKFRPTRLGFSRDKEGVRNMVREIKGEGTGDQDASAFAQAWKTMAEYTRKRLEAAGARIDKLDDWGMPQYNDAARVAANAADGEDWVNQIWGWLDIQRMTDESGLTDAQLYVYLRDEVYQNIITEGAHKIDLSRVSGRPTGRGLLAQLNQHRFMHYKDADSWMAYQDRFGTTDYLTAMTDFIDRQSVNIAAMEVLGPNPDIGFQHLRNLMRKDGISVGKMDALEHLYNNVMGRVGTANIDAAQAMSEIRGFNVVAHLGNAFLSMITDPAFLAMTAKFNDLPALKTVIRGLRMAVKSGMGNTEEFRFATQIGFAADYAMDRMSAAARFTDTRPGGFMQRASDLTMRLNFMHPVTIANRAAFQLEYAASLARDAGKPYDQLSKARQEAFKQAMITPKMWDDIRAKPLTIRDGVPYMDMNAVGSGTNKEEATRLFGLIHQETDYAVPTPGAESRALTNQGEKRGSIKGEVFRSLGEFKSFPIALVMTHLRRVQHQNSMNKLGYGAGLFGSLFVLGYIAFAAKEVSRGRDVPSLLDEDGNPDPKVILRVLAQSGGLGIYGDLVFQDATRFGTSLAEQVAGPTLGLAEDIRKTGQHAAMSLYEFANSDDDDAWQKFKTQMGRNLQTYKPEVWYTRGIQDRAINRFIDGALDEDHFRKLDKAERRRDKDSGQENFWAEDEWLPERAPGIAEGARAD